MYSAPYKRSAAPKRLVRFSAIAVFGSALYSLIGTALAQSLSNEPQPVQRFEGNGWLIASGNDHGTEFKAYLETKKLLVTPNAIYYVGAERVETVEQGTPGKAHWDFSARCAVSPDFVRNMPVGIYASSPEMSPTEQFIEVNPKAATAPNTASRGWYALWWAACWGVVKKF